MGGGGEGASYHSYTWEREIEETKIQAKPVMGKSVRGKCLHCISPSGHFQLHDGGWGSTERSKVDEGGGREGGSGRWIKEG